MDLIMFMGQSNMAGRGIVNDKWTEKAPKSIAGSGFEFRPVSDPARLHTIVEPFGVNENRLDGIDDGKRKTGSMVTSFVNAYYKECDIPVCAVSASKGGTSILQWQPGTPFFADLSWRLVFAEQYCKANDIELEHIYAVWCQGETDADNKMPSDDYKEYFHCFFEGLKTLGVEKCFLIAIGKYNGGEENDHNSDEKNDYNGNEENDCNCGGENCCNGNEENGCNGNVEKYYSEIHDVQLSLAAEEQDLILVSDSFIGMKARGLMKDDYHYFQKAYNEVGEEAGRNSALARIHQVFGEEKTGGQYTDS